MESSAVSSLVALEWRARADQHPRNSATFQQPLGCRALRIKYFDVSKSDQ